MKIIWSLLAHEAYMDICDTIFTRFGYKAEQEYIAAIDEAIQQISRFPNSGKEEKELAADGSVHSILVQRLSKVIYYVEDDVLHIADVWTTRQDPSILATRFTA